MINKKKIISIEKKYNGIDGSFVCYSVTTANNIIVDVPLNEANTDYQEILEWVAAGNTITDPGE